MEQRIISCGMSGIEARDIYGKGIYSNNRIGDIFSLCRLSRRRIGAGGVCGEVHIVEENMEISHTFHTGGGWVRCLLCVEKKIWAGETYGSIYILDIETQEVHKLEQDIYAGTVVNVLIEGRGGSAGCVISGGGFGTVGVWGIDQHLIYIISIPSNIINTINNINTVDSMTITSLSFAHNLLIIGDREGYLRVWDMENHKLIYTFRAHAQHIVGKACVGDTYFLLTGSKDRFVRLIDIIGGKVVKEIRIGYMIMGITTLHI